MTKGANGVWEVTRGPLAPGAYRYNFNVDGVAVVDPRSAAISESNNNVWSLVVVPGPGLMDTKDVPHGAVAAVRAGSTWCTRKRTARTPGSIGAIVSSNSRRNCSGEAAS